MPKRTADPIGAGGQSEGRKGPFGLAVWDALIPGCEEDGATIMMGAHIASHIDAPECDRLPHLFCSRLGLRRTPVAEMAGVSEGPGLLRWHLAHHWGAVTSYPGSVSSVLTNSNRSLARCARI